MGSSFAEKWYPLILIGLVAMFLSEFLIWNPLLQILTGRIFVGVLGTVRVIVLTSFMYIALLAIGVDVVQRFKIRDAVSLLLLGSVYGLVLEGVFANKVFDPVGFGPKLFDVYFVHLLFTALSWHPLIDFLICFLLFQLLLKDRLGFGASKISLRELILLLAFSFFWFIWPYSQWFPKQLPSGIPFLALRLVQLIFPMVLIGIFIHLTFKRKTDYVPEKILGPASYFIFVAYIVLFAAERYILIENKAAFWFFCLVILFYILLFALYLRYGRKLSGTSIYQEGFPITGEFLVSKYLKLCAIIIVFYFVFQFVTGFFGLEKFYLLLTYFFVACMLLVALVLPVVVFVTIVRSPAILIKS